MRTKFNVNDLTGFYEAFAAVTIFAVPLNDINPQEFKSGPFLNASCTDPQDSDCLRERSDVADFLRIGGGQYAMMLIGVSNVPRHVKGPRLRQLDEALAALTLRGAEA